MFGPGFERFDRKTKRSASVEARDGHSLAQRRVLLHGALGASPHRRFVNLKVPGCLLDTPPTSGFARFRHERHRNAQSYPNQVEKTSKRSIAPFPAIRESALARKRMVQHERRTATCLLVTGVRVARAASKPDARDDSPSNWRSSGATPRTASARPAIRLQPSNGRDAEQGL